MFRTVPIVLRAAVAAVVLSVVGCSRPEAPRAKAPAAAPPAPAQSGTVSAPFDVGAVIRQVHFAYRPEGEGWRGGHSTYDVQAGEEGLTLTPFHYPTAERTPDDLAAVTPSARARLREEPTSVPKSVKGASLQLGAARLSRGHTPLGGGRAKGRVEADGHLSFGRPGVVEHLRSGDEGVEQSWAFAARPEGGGDLLVRIPVKGLAHTGETEGGLHFADAKTGLGFRYGHATWVDAAGSRTSLKAEYSRGHIALRVPSALVEASVYPAVLDPVISPEVGTDTPVHGPAANDQGPPSVASNGTNYLVTWLDSRGENSDIYGARVTSTGRVLDATGLAISTAAHIEYDPAVASNGTDYLVIWMDNRNNGRPDIYGTRVTSAGAVLDATGLAIATEARDPREPSVASNGTDYLVIWSDFRNPGWDTYGTRVTSAGAVLDGTGLVLSTAANIPSSPAVASNGTDYLVTWSDHRDTGWDIYGTRVTSVGVVLDATGLAISTAASTQQQPSVASNGTDYLVTWSDYRGGTTSDIYGARVTSAGVVLDATGLAISTAANSQAAPSVASNGTDYLVTWSDERSGSLGGIYGTRAYGARVTSAGVVLDATGLGLSTVAKDQYALAVASNGTDYLVTWLDKRNNGLADIYGTRVTSAGAVLDATGLVLANVTNRQNNPAVASNGTNYLVTWADARGGRALDIYGARVTSAGVVLDATGLALSTSAGYQDYPAVASNGTDYLVTWTDGRRGEWDIYGTRVTGAGEVLDATGIPLSTAPSDQREPAVASNGTDYLVTWVDHWTDLRGGGGRKDIYGTRVTSAGAVLDATGLALSITAYDESVPAVASNGTDYLVTWRTFLGANWDIHGTRVTSAGEVLDATGIPLSTADSYQDSPAVASNGTDYLVTWMDKRGEGWDIYGTRVTSAGEVLDATGIPLSTEAGLQEQPSVASNGTDYLVTWMDDRTGGGDIYGTWVTGAGAVLKPGGMLISGEATREASPAVAAAHGLTYFVVYSRFDASPDLSTRRVRGRFVTFDERPTAMPRSFILPEDSALAVTLSGTAAEDPSLTYDVATQPSHGTLSGTPPGLTYTPRADFHGADSFTFTVRDGASVSEPATVSLTVTPVNDAPVASALHLTLAEGTPLTFTLRGHDVEGDPLTYAFGTPAHGTLTGAAPDLIYSPRGDFTGTDVFTVTVSDGAVNSSPATITLVVEASPEEASTCLGCSGAGGSSVLFGLFALVGLRLRRRSAPPRNEEAPGPHRHPRASPR